MSCTRNLLASSLWAQSIIGYQPVAFAGNDDPALTAANHAKQTMLGPPFAWPFNRNELQFPLPLNTQDVLAAAADFGWPERIALRDAQGKVKSVEIKNDLSPDSIVQRPASVAALLDANDGTVLFRFNARAEQNYTALVTYQRRAVPLTSLASLWSPLPDRLSYIFDLGYLAELCLLVKDARYPVFAQKFTTHLLSAQDGLSSIQRSIFLGNWLEVMAASQRTTAGTQQGISARGQS